MKTEDTKFDNLIREKLDEYSVPPSPHIWEGIREELARKRKRRLVVFYRITGIAAALLLAFIAGWYYNNLHEPLKPVLQETASVVKTDKREIQDNNNSGSRIVTDLNKKENLSDGMAPGFNTNKNNSQKPPRSESSLIIQNRDTYSYSLVKKKPGFIKPENLVTRLVAVNRVIKSEEEVIITEGEMAIIENNRNQMKSEDSHWKLGLHLSPEYSSYSANHSATYARNLTYEGSKGGTNMGGGFSLQYKTGKKWSIESGVYYSQNGQKSENTYNYQADYAFSDILPSGSVKSFISTPVNIVQGRIEMNSSAGVIALSEKPQNSEIAADLIKTGAFSNNMVLQGEISQIFNFMEIPLYLRYQLVDSRIGVQLMGGVNTNILVGNSTYLESGNSSDKIGKTEDIRNLSYSGTVGVGLTWALAKHLAFSFEPRFNYSLNSLSSNSDIDLKPYRLGLYTGICYEF